MWTSDQIAKRAFDVSVAFGVLLVAAPVLLLVALAVRLDTHGPALFRQTRVGRRGKTFEIVKFRSMTVEQAGAGPLVTTGSDRRITRVGRVLRRTKLDELPQLWNILRGEMSLVGPRPEVPRYVAHWTELQRARILGVRPGLTDPAAIAFRDEEKLLAGVADAERYYIEHILPQKLAMYETYVAKRSFWNDIAILLRTVWAVARPTAGATSLLMRR